MLFIQFCCRAISSNIFGERIYQEIADYQNVMEGVPYTGVSIPMIATTVMGFEYPKTSHALTHYVGQLLMSSPPLIDKEMGDWLITKEEKSVLYISMGTTGIITEKWLKH